MIATGTPTWITITLSVLTGGLAGTLLNTLVTDRRRRKELDQQRLLHKADARLQVLKDATATALLYRERIVAALKEIVGEDSLGAEPMWSWNAEYVMRYRTLETELYLLFGPAHDIVEKWRLCVHALAQAAEYARSRKPRGKQSASVASLVKQEVEFHRAGTRADLTNFLDAGTRSLDEIQPPRA